MHAGSRVVVKCLQW